MKSHTESTGNPITPYRYRQGFLRAVISKFDSHVPVLQKLTDAIPPPCTELLSDFPLRPRILGNLLPQQGPLFMFHLLPQSVPYKSISVNLWLGNSSDGTSSGLHHDYHDNLYILLRGKKTFTIFSPADAHSMYTYGKIRQQWPNGLITYKGRPTRADGAGGSNLLHYTLRKAGEDLDELRTNPRASLQDIASAERAYAKALTFANDVALGDEGPDTDEDSDEDGDDFKGPAFADAGDDDDDFGSPPAPLIGRKR